MENNIGGVDGRKRNGEKKKVEKGGDGSKKEEELRLEGRIRRKQTGKG
jgi:hypothetical protein